MTWKKNVESENHGLHSGHPPVEKLLRYMIKLRSEMGEKWTFFNWEIYICRTLSVGVRSRFDFFNYFFIRCVLYSLWKISLLQATLDCSSIYGQSHGLHRVYLNSKTMRCMVWCAISTHRMWAQLRQTPACKRASSRQPVERKHSGKLPHCQPGLSIISLCLAVTLNAIQNNYGCTARTC